MIFQDPFSSLNPRLRVEAIVGEVFWAGGIKTASRSARRDLVVERLEMVGLSAAHLRRFPHEFSGGQRQRLGIARALASEPEFIVADEPVSALDVSVPAQVLNLLLEFHGRLGLAMLFITHDLAVMRFLRSEVAVMYLGRIMETGRTAEVAGDPLHPHTRALLSAVPSRPPGGKAEPDNPQGRHPEPPRPALGPRLSQPLPGGGGGRRRGRAPADREEAGPFFDLPPGLRRTRFRRSREGHCRQGARGIRPFPLDSC